jgi:CPA2 family monovalent cation:H+ antiporter-2
MLFDPWVLVGRPLQVLAVVAIIIDGQVTGSGNLLVMAFRYPLNAALTVSPVWRRSVSFHSFWWVWALLWVLLPPEGQSLVLAGYCWCPFALNQVVFSRVDPAQRWLRTASSGVVRRLELDMM